MRVLWYRRRPLLPVILALLLLGATWGPALADDASDLINELMCPADCVMTLAACDMTEAVQMRGFIKTKVAEGWSKQQITDTLVAQYGERLLAAPTKQGFNLTAWITPFAVIAAGGVLISVLVTTWIRQRRRLDARARAAVKHASAVDLQTYRSRLAAELSQFE
jgi:cytochrome c-type biogenesis protein CcmH